ncbi:MAG: HlyD family efflux transporter periplasmic adaptor subunit [Planctomycetota bacterium]
MQPTRVRRPTASDDSARTTAASAGPNEGVWEEFAALIDDTRQQAVACPPDNPAAFYRALLARGVDAVAAEAGVVWRGEGSSRRVLATTGANDTPTPPCPQREQALRQAARTAGACRCETPTASHLAITVRPTIGQNPIAPAVLELALARGQSDAYYDAAERLLTTVAEAAAEFENRVLARAQEARVSRQAALWRLPQAVAGDLGLEPTAMRIANEVAPLVGADRVAVVVPDGRGPRVIALSGAGRVDSRGPSAAAWRRVAISSEGSAEELAAALDRCRDTTHAREIRVAPVRLLTSWSEDDSDRNEPLGWLIAEWFDAAPENDDATPQLTEIAVTVAPSLHAATEAADHGFGGIARRAKRAALTLSGIAAALAAVVGLLLVPVPHKVTATGVLSPLVERRAFAPCDATVAATHVESGDRVTAGQLLVELSDPASLLQLEALEGQIETLARQHAAAQAQRLAGDHRGGEPAERLRFAAEEQRLAAELEALRAQRELALAERDRLFIRSPIDGVVTTWDAADRLAGKPVNRGEPLLVVADDRDEWRLELQAAEDRFATIRAAAERADEPLRVAYTPVGVDSEPRFASLTQIAHAANVERDAFGVESRFAPLIATPDHARSPLGDTPPLPQTSVHARIDCGERTLGDAALGDAWRRIVTWWRL